MRIRIKKGNPDPFIDQYPTTTLVFLGEYCAEPGEERLPGRLLPLREKFTCAFVLSIDVISGKTPGGALIPSIAYVLVRGFICVDTNTYM